MHELIASPFTDSHFVFRPGSPGALKISQAKYLELAEAATTPSWLAEAVRDGWGSDITTRPFSDVLLYRHPSAYGFVRATYELNLGCNYDCEHCYLGLKRFEGMDWPQRERVLHILRDAGVLWLQLTGGEPMIDKLFTETYTLAYDLGMVLTILSNGSRLSSPHVLELLTTRRAADITLSMYGATEASYDGLTRRRGSYKLFMRGLAAALEAELPIKLSLIVTHTNEGELEAMQAFAEARGIPHNAFVNMAPTISGGVESVLTQSVERRRARKVFTGCNAGHTFFHVDPHGKADICKIGRDPYVSLTDEGVEGLTRLGQIADSLLLRQGGCSGCTLSGSCGTCMPLAALYRKAKSPLVNYCQHGKREEVRTA